MKLMDNATVFEGELAFFWFDESGILCAISKDTPRTLEKQQKNYVFVKQITGNKKVCLLSDTTRSALQDKTTRNYMAEELPHMFTAMAVVSDSVLGKYITNLFLNLKQQPIPIKFFSSEQEAKKWLKNYL
ncbi:MAG: STAS/SEC14 domain-containing protein [Bacteroidota bacterium]